MTPDDLKMTLIWLGTAVIFALVFWLITYLTERG
jgi:hypothetical protein